MTKYLIIGASIIAISLVLTGCGGGGDTPTPTPGPVPGPTPAPVPGPSPGPAPGPGPTPCSDLLKRGHCSACQSDGKEVSCASCSGGYTLNEGTVSTPELSCTKKCGTIPQKPSKPSNVQGNNGVAWPMKCHDDIHEARFFGIGDWGGFCGWNGKQCENDVKSSVCSGTYGIENIDAGKPCPMPNRHGVVVGEIDGRAQNRVSERMQDRQKALTAESTPAQFILNVGDNFYPGGIDVHCGLGDHGGLKVQQQFERVWKGIYGGNLAEMEWWGVLGNHDYGGACYIKGWDQQIWYTYNQDKWTMPGQYWARKVQYKNFAIDFFFIDGNWFDTDNGYQSGDHNLCNRDNNPGKYCELQYYPGDGGVCAGAGPTSGDDCPSWFETLWNDQYKWMMKVIPASDADWQIVVTHYPGTYGLGREAHGNRIDWTKWGPAMGIDLVLTGHTHMQKILYGDHGHEGYWVETASAITGGGGGVTSEFEPTLDGNDDTYGFMEFTATLTELNIKTYTHGGTQQAMILRNQTTVKPVAKKSDEEIIRLGLDPSNLLKMREINV